MSDKKIIFKSLLITRRQAEFTKDYMEDLDRTKYVENLSKAETEEEKKNITAEFEAQVNALIFVLIFYINFFLVPGDEAEAAVPG